MRRLIEIATERRVTVVMIMVAVGLFGMVSLSRLNLNLLPDVSYPTVTIRTELTGAAPVEVENLVTKPIEEAVGVIRNVSARSLGFPLRPVRRYAGVSVGNRYGRRGSRGPRKDWTSCPAAGGKPPPVAAISTPLPNQSCGSGCCYDRIGEPATRILPQRA